MSALHRFWARSLFVSALLLVPASVRAQQVDPQAMAMAQSLYEQGIELMDAKNFADACPKLEQVTKLVPKGIGARQALAECFEGQGRLASAWGQYMQVESLAIGAGEDATAAAAREQAAKLKPKLATVTIVVPEALRGVAGLSVTFDRLPQQEGAWGLPIPVDAGKHAIEVKAPGRQTWTREVAVVGDGVAVDLKVPQLEVVHVKPQDAGMRRGGEPSPPASSGLRTAGFVGMGLGVAGLGLGAILGGMAIGRNDESNEGHCRADDHCSRVGYDLRKEALALGNGSTAALVVGGVAIAAGVTLFAVSLSGAKGDDGGRKTSLVVGPGGIGLRGVW